MLCRKTAAIMAGGKAAELPAAPFICATGFWFGPCVINWVTGRKIFSLKLVPVLAEAMGSLQHSHIFQF